MLIVDEDTLKGFTGGGEKVYLKFRSCSSGREVWSY